MKKIVKGLLEVPRFETEKEAIEFITAHAEDGYDLVVKLAEPPDELADKPFVCLKSGDLEDEPTVH